MIRTCGALVAVALAAVFQVIYFGLAYPFDFSLEFNIPREQQDPQIGSQMYHPYQERIPRHCWTPPREVNIYQCCPIPKLYPDEFLKSCGIVRKPVKDPGIFKPRSEQNCNASICLMTKANLLWENKTIDYEKLKAYIDDWAKINPDFTEAILSAKTICAKPPSFKMEPARCEHERIFICLTGNILWNCKLKKYESCQILKNHIDECRPYYIQPKEPEPLMINDNFV